MLEDKNPRRSRVQVLLEKRYNFVTVVTKDRRYVWRIFLFYSRRGFMKALLPRLPEPVTSVT